MHAEIIAIGTELLLGEIVDTNSAHIAHALREIGLDLRWMSAVGDNEARIAELVTQAARRSTVVITTGGLGPTVDDPTREAIARATADGVRTRLVSMRLLAPAQPDKLAAALAGVKRVLVVEQNHGGQLLKYLRSEFRMPGEVRSLRRPGPLPIRAEEVHRQLVQWSRP